LVQEIVQPVSDGGTLGQLPDLLLTARQKFGKPNPAERSLVRVREDAENERDDDASEARNSPHPLQPLTVGSDVEIAAAVAEDLKAAFGEVPYADGSFWRFAETRWLALTEQELRLGIHRYDGVWFSPKSRVRLSKNRINSVIHELGMMLAQPD